MKKIAGTSRIIYIILALLLSFVLVYGLTMISSRSEGPIHSMLTNAADLVRDVEKEVILDKRENKRSDKLEWFKTMRDNKAQLLHSGKILFGASDNSSKESYEKIFDLEDSLQLSFPIIHIYQAWGEKESHEFPKVETSAIYELGSVPMITWEPWVSDFSDATIPGLLSLEKRDKGAMQSIADGKYDSFIKEWAGEAKIFSHPFYLRFGHEMNEPYRYPWGPQNNTPAEFVAAWKHIHKIFREAGATNVIWVWSPHASFGYFDAYYPGSPYVDIVATGALNFGTVYNWSKWYTFTDIFEKYYQKVDSLQKPMMIAEFGSLSVGGNRAKWFSDALNGFDKRYPLVNSIVFFHYSNDNTSADKTVDWYIKNDKKVTTEIRKQIKKWGTAAK